MQFSSQHEVDETAHPVGCADASVRSPRPAVSGQRSNHRGAWQIAQRALRGRYRSAVYLGLIGAATGAVLGWLVARPVYQSEGIIRVASALPHVMQETDQNKPLPMFDAYLQAQQAMIGSPRLGRLAMQEPVWRGARPSDSPDTLEGFLAGLKVELKSRSDCLRVSFIHEDPRTAAAGVNAVIEAYQQHYKAREDEQQQHRLSVLEQRREDVTRKLLDARMRMEQLGHADSDPLYLMNLQQVARLDASLSEVRSRLDLVRQQASTGRPDPGVNANSRMTADAIGMVDPVMRRYLDEQEQKEEQIDQASQRLGESHPFLIQLKQSLTRIQSRLNDYVEAYRAFRFSNGQLSPVQQPLGAAGLVHKSLEELIADETRLVAAQEQAKAQMAAFAEKRAQLEWLRMDAERFGAELTAVSQRMDALRSEGSGASRLSVISDGQIPLSPRLDRRLKASAAGGVAGAASPIALLLLHGLLLFRYRSCRDAAQDWAGAAPLFMVVPSVSERRGGLGCHLAEPMLAARSVHHLRVQLQSASSGARRSRVFLVTSSTEGEGKTSLSLALGFSFAAAGARVLLIDADFIARGLTHQCAGTGFPGLAEGLRDGAALSHVRKMRMGLSVLTAGQAHEADAYRLSAQALRRLLDEAREQFDTILIDSGPLLGSLEPSIIAREVDEVIFALSCGQRPATVQRSLQQLGTLGANVTALVYTHAMPQEFERQIRALPSERAQSDLEMSSTELPPTVARFGPFIAAVLSSVRFTRKEDTELLSPNDPGLLRVCQPEGPLDGNDRRKQLDEGTAA